VLRTVRSLRGQPSTTKKPRRDELERLSKEDLIELVLRLPRPEKTSHTSSKPPSTDRKERRENARPGGAKPGHEGHKRKLCANPDGIRNHVPTCCEHCGCAFEDGAPAGLIGEYDETEIPPVRPFVRRHRRFAVRCGSATPVAQGTPFGPRVHALAKGTTSLGGFESGMR
jgi:transposase